MPSFIGPSSKWFAVLARILRLLPSRSNSHVVVGILRDFAVAAGADFEKHHIA